MSDADARSDIEREFEEAKKTAREYLRAVGVLSPEGKDKQERDTEQRWREERKMRNTILRGWAPDAVVPNDPSARDATNLGRQYLHCGRDDEVLGALLDRDRSHPAYRLALEWVVCGLLAKGADVPDRLQRWDEEPRESKAPVKGRWRPEPVQNWLIGMVVEAMVTGTNILVLYGEGEREREQLQRDLQAVCAEAAKPIEELSIEDVRERVNKRRARRRGKPDARRPLSEDELVALTKQPSTGPSGGVHMIRLTSDLGPEVRRSFANLRWISGEVAKGKHRTYSICDAVAEVLREELPRKGRGERNKPWIGAVEDAWRAFGKDPPRYTN